jgi:hypothetical protein
MTFLFNFNETSQFEIPGKDNLIEANYVPQHPGSHVIQVRLFV